MPETVTNPLPTYVDVSDITEALKTSDRSIRRLIASGRFPPPDLRLGRRLKWKLDTVIAFLEQN